MKSIFVDANVFLRFLTMDDAGQMSKVISLFKKAEKGNIRLVTGPPVLFEIAWTLKKAYKKSSEEILDLLASLVSTSWLDMTDRDLVEEAVNIARISGQDFADAYIHVSSIKTGADSIATFNKKHFEMMGSVLMDL